jgi:hypothetical protein
VASVRPEAAGLVDGAAACLRLAVRVDPRDLASRRELATVLGVRAVAAEARLAAKAGEGGGAADGGAGAGEDGKAAAADRDEALRVLREGLWLVGRPQMAGRCDAGPGPRLGMAVELGLLCLAKVRAGVVVPAWTGCKLY